MSARRELAGYTGTLILEEADEDEQIERYRFQGVRAGVTATAAITVTAAGEITAEVHPGHGSDLTADALIAALAEVLAKRSTEEKVREPAGGGEVAAPPEAAARRRRALVAAGAAAALTAWALKGRR